MPTSLNAISFVLASCSGWSYKASPYNLAEFCVTWGTGIQWLENSVTANNVGCI